MRTPKYITCAVLLLMAMLLSAPTVRPAIATPAEAAEIEDTAPEIIPVPPSVSTSGLYWPEQYTAPEPEETPTETAEDTETAIWREDVPLRAELQAVLLDACAEHGIDPLLMLGLIETESNFQEDVVSRTGDYGLCQLNHNYFDPGMTPEENLRAGIGLLGLHLKTYGNISAALTAYHWGHDNGSRGYASVVLSRAAAWGYQ